MQGWAGSVRAITLVTEDLAQARRFYEEAFGLPVVFETKDSVVFEFGDTLVNLLAAASAPEAFEPTPVAAPGGGSRTMFTIEVDDVDAICTELTHRGVELLSGPVDRPWGPRTATFADPGGHLWEIAR